MRWPTRATSAWVMVALIAVAVAPLVLLGVTLRARLRARRMPAGPPANDVQESTHTVGNSTSFGARGD